MWHVIKYGLDWIGKTCTGLIKHSLIKNGEIKHGSIKHAVIKHAVMKHGLKRRFYGSVHFGVVVVD